jgi:hypothetical protein
MGRIDVNLPDKLEEEFRREVAKELGMRRGNLSIALQEGIKLWIETHKQRRTEIANKAWITRKGGKKELE